MSTDSDLADWGESPATPSEEALGIWLDSVLARIECGSVAIIQPEAFRADNPNLCDRGAALAPMIGLLYECAASLWENTVMQPTDTNDSLYSPSQLPLKTGEEPVLHVEGRDPPAAQVGRLPDPLPGEFRILQVLGEGAFGRVLLAEDLNLGWRVALKTLKLPATSTMGPHVLAALRTEAQHLAQLNHPNIVRVHAWREARGDYFLVLQFVAGGSLADRLKVEKALAWQDAARYIADVGEALVAAHERGVIHRDIKPDNILWDQVRDEALLTDFGVSARLAESGTSAGTPIYMAPEAFEGQVSPALDVYSLAATLYRLTTGYLPFVPSSVADLRYQKLQGLPDPDPHCQVMPEALEQIIRAGLAGRPDDRPCVAEFVATLRATLNQLLADDLVTPRAEAGSKVPVNLRLVVGRRVQGDVYEPVATTRPTSVGLKRDMKKVPQSPEQVSVRTGERVRVEVVADMAGYVTVFNIGPTGNLNLLYPDDPDTKPRSVEANRPLHVVDVEMAPPAGAERVFAVWSKEPMTIRLDKLLSIVEPGGGTTSPYQSTRDMKRVQRTIAGVPGESWTAAVVSIEHLQG